MAGGFRRASVLAALLVVVLVQQRCAEAAGRPARALQEDPHPPADQPIDQPGDQAAEQQAQEPLHPVPAEFIITNDTLGSMLKRTASPKEKAIIFTTTRWGGSAMQHCGWLL